MAFVISAGQLAAVSRTWPVPIGPRPAGIQLSDTVAYEYAEIWRRQPQVRTVVGFLARNIAQLGLHAFRRDSDTDRQRLADHPLVRLLARPNPVGKVTRYRLIEQLVSDLAIYDDAYWAKVRASAEAPVGALVRLPPARTWPIGESWLAVEKYEVRGNTGRLEIPADQVVHFHGYNPDDQRVGDSPMQALRGLLIEEYEANLSRQQMWRNGARASGFITRPANAPKWSDGARRRFKSEFADVYTGDGPDAGGTPILEDGMTYTQAGMDPKAAQYIEARKLTREEVAAAYYIAPPLVGILEHATYSNIREQHKQLYQDTLGPWLTGIEQDIELQLLPDLDPAGADDRVYVEFNIAEKLKGSFEEQAAQLQTAVGAPYMTRNEARARQNLPHIDGADELIVPLNVLEGGLASPRDTAPPAGDGKAVRPRRKSVRFKARGDAAAEAKHRELMVGFFRRQAAAVLSAAGAKAHRSALTKTSLDEVFDIDRWNRELAADLFKLAVSTARAVAELVLRALGLDPDGYDEPRTTEFLMSWSERVAKATNGATRDQVAAALEADDPTEELQHVFEVAETSRAEQSATTQVTALSGFASTEAVKQQAGDTATKTWITGENPRPSHAAMDGVTVGIDDKFPNGLMWPADAAGDVDEVAGCNCELELFFD